MDVAAQGAIKTLFSAEAIAARVDQLAGDIAATRLEDLIVVAVLKGSFIFAADLDQGAPPSRPQARDRFHLSRKL